MDVKTYKNLQAINSGLLLAWEQHPKYAEEIWKKMAEPRETTFFDIGSAVDCLITRTADFKDEFYICEAKISPGMKALADTYSKLFLNAPEGLIDDKTLILSARDIVGYDSRLKEDTVIERFHKEARPYLHEREAHLGETALTLEDYNLCQRMVDTFNKAKHIRNFFHNIEVEYQKACVLDLKGGLILKGLLDVFAFNPEERKIIDIKTYDSRNGSALVNYFKYKTYYQLGFYRYLLTRSSKFDDVPIVDCYIIALDKAEILPPIIYQLPDEHLSIAKSGGKVNNTYIRGFGEGITNLHWHIKEDYWDSYINPIIEIH